MGFNGLQPTRPQGIQVKNHHKEHPFIMNYVFRVDLLDYEW